MEAFGTNFNDVPYRLTPLLHERRNNVIQKHVDQIFGSEFNSARIAMRDGNA